jgi:hypothetical protein
VEVEAIIVNAETVPSGLWGVSALGLTFRLSDGRTTVPTYVAGTMAVGEFLAIFHCESVQDLVGTPLRIDLVDSAAGTPTVREVFPPPPVPDLYRRAFQDGEPPAASETQS